MPLEEIGKNDKKGATDFFCGTLFSQMPNKREGGGYIYYVPTHLLLSL